MNNLKEIGQFIQKTLREMDTAEAIAASAGAGTGVSSGIQKSGNSERHIIGSICGHSLFSDIPGDVWIESQFRKADELCKKNPEITPYVHGGQR